MLSTITIILSVLVALNFLLLKVSCNKTTQIKNTEKPLIIKRKPTVIATQPLSTQLAPTGS